jgi:hypothetical protein
MYPKGSNQWLHKFLRVQRQEGRIQRDDNAQLKINLLIAYFESGRQELISRVSQRDNAVLLFLGAATAIFGVAFGNITRPAILFAISPLGLGAAVIYTQHNTLIGQLGRYCGLEVTEQADKILGRCPDSWETSESLFDPRLTEVSNKPHGLWGIPKIYRDRLYSSILLILIPGITGAIIGLISNFNLWGWCGLAVDALTAGWAARLLVNSAHERTKLRNEVAKWRKDRERKESATAPSM